MIINKKYDVFIAYHGSSGENSVLQKAEEVYDYLSGRGLRCFLFSRDNNNGVYKANFMKIMQSSLMLLVCNDKLFRCENGEMNYIKNYHLYVELDSFFALAQSDNTPYTINDAALLFFTENDRPVVTPSPEKIHPLFDNRDSFYIATTQNEEDVLEELYEWVEDRLELSRESAGSNELIAVLNGRCLGGLDKKIEGLDLKKLVRNAKHIKCMGISNWTFSLTDGCKNLIKGIRTGTSFEMIFLDPLGECAKIRSEEEQKDTKAQIDASFDMIKSRLRTKFGDNNLIREHLKIYTYDRIPRENLIFIYTDEDAYVIVQNYSFKSPGATCPSFIFKNSDAEGESLFEYYENVYNDILNDLKTKEYDLFS